MRALLLCLLAAPLTLSAQRTPEAASAAEQQWLRQIDAGDYQAAYESAAKIMRDAATEQQFAQAMRNARAPLGDLRSRQPQDAKPTTTLPGAPDGHYVVAHYQSAFAKKASAVETVVASQGEDGSWRVSGYFIR